MNMCMLEKYLLLLSKHVAKTIKIRTTNVQPREAINLTSLGKKMQQIKYYIYNVERVAK